MSAAKDASGDLDLCYLSADAAMAAFRAKALSPVELLDAVIARAEATEPAVNAFSATYFDEARAKARAAEARFMKTDGRVRALEGVPVAIKDAGDVRGKVTTAGSLAVKDVAATTSAPVNERVIRAGGIVHARSATPEFSCAAVCWSRRHGVTRNPWRRDATPGGSSGGAGAALAAGSTTLATGSDIAGSVRIPASCCGVIGLKPTYGRNPNDAPFNLDFYCHPGPMARSMADLVRLQNVMCGPHRRDPAALAPKLTLKADAASIAGWRIAYSPDLGFFEVDPGVRAQVEAALRLLEDLGATVEEVSLGWTEALMEAAETYLGHIFGASLAPYLDAEADALTDYARAFAEKGRMTSALAFYQSLEAVGDAWRAVEPIFQKFALLACPTLACPPVAAEFNPARDPLAINGVSRPAMLGWVMTTPFNMLSRCPALSLPAGRSADGLPVGLQLVARPYRDADVVRAGFAYEAASGGWFADAASRPAI